MEVSGSTWAGGMDSRALHGGLDGFGRDCSYPVPAAQRLPCFARGLCRCHPAKSSRPLRPCQAPSCSPEAAARRKRGSGGSCFLSPQRANLTQIQLLAPVRGGRSRGNCPVGRGSGAARHSAPFNFAYSNPCGFTPLACAAPALQLPQLHALPPPTPLLPRAAAPAQPPPRPLRAPVSFRHTRHA